MQITLQNTVKQAKSFGAQDSGYLPLYMGGLSSIDLRVDQFLVYYDQFLKVTSIKNRSDGDCRFLISDDKTPASEIGCAQLLDGILAGHLGAEAQAQAKAWKDARDALAAAERQAVADRRGQMIGDIARG